LTLGYARPLSLYAFEGKASSGETLKTIERLRQVYRLDLDVSASHRLTEDGGASAGDAK